MSGSNQRDNDNSEWNARKNPGDGTFGGCGHAAGTAFDEGGFSIPFVEGLPADAEFRDFSLAEIDLEDERFQHRSKWSLAELKRSLVSRGQVNPVVLWGSEAPYKIIDGFRRTRAIHELGWKVVRGIARDDIDEGVASDLAFIENVHRKNLGAFDRAMHFVRLLDEEGVSKRDVAKRLDVSVRTIERYLGALDLPEPFLEALREERINMKHAEILRGLELEDPEALLEAIEEEGLSGQDLNRMLKSAVPGGRPRKYIQLRKGGFRMYGFVYGPGMGGEERKRLHERLCKALEVVEADL